MLDRGGQGLRAVGSVGQQVCSCSRRGTAHGPLGFGKAVGLPIGLYMVHPSEVVWEDIGGMRPACRSAQRGAELIAAPRGTTWWCTVSDTRAVLVSARRVGMVW